MMREERSLSKLKSFYAADLRLSYAAFKAKWRIGDAYVYRVSQSDDTNVSRLDFIRYITGKRAELAAEHVGGC